MNPPGNRDQSRAALIRIHNPRASPRRVDHHQVDPRDPDLQTRDACVDDDSVTTMIHNRSRENAAGG